MWWKRSSTLFGADNGRLPPWLIMLRANILLPILIALLWPIGRIVEWSPYPAMNDYFARVVLMIGISVILAVSLQLINGIAGQFSLGHAGFMAVGAYAAGYATATFTPDFASDPTAADPTTVLLFYLSLLIVLAVAAGILMLLFTAIRRSRRLYVWLPYILATLVVAWFIADIKLAQDAARTPPYCCFSRIIAGIGRLFSFLVTLSQRVGPALSHHIPLGIRTPLTLIVAMLGGGVIAALAGLMIGLPTLRLRGDYLAIATLGFAEIIRVAVTTTQSLGQARGMSVPVYRIQPDAEDGIAGQRIFPWIYTAMLITIVAVWRLAHSSKGRALRTVREDEIAAASMGIDTTHHKVLAFVFGAFFAGVAGASDAHFDGYLHPNSFGIMKSIELVVMVTLGGMGSISGAILAAIILTWLPEFLRSPADWIAFFLRPFGVQSSDALNLPKWLLDVFATVGNNRMVFYSALLIVMMLLRPRGLLGGYELWRRRRMAIPPRESSEAGGAP